MIKVFISLICGGLFGAGLTISHMVDPKKIIRFLDITGEWDPSLILVMLSASLLTMISYHFTFKMTKPLLDKKFYTPDATIIDKRFIGGSILFGIGWGISGLCPGPALASLAYGDPLSFVFILAIIPGSYLSLRPFKSS